MNKSNSYPLLWLIVFLAVLQLTGCASTPAKPSFEKKETGPVFYPPKPNKPRIQYLTTLSGAADLQKDKKRSSMASFILGEEKESAHAVTKPYGVAIFDGNVYALDTRGSGYAIFDLKNNIFRAVGGMQKPINMTIDSNGTKYVTDTKMKRILVFDRDDNPIQVFGEDGNYRPSDVAIIGGKLFVADMENNKIQVLDKRTGEFLYSFSSGGSQDGELFFPTNLAVGPDDNLYVSDTGNFRVQLFTPKGRYLRQIGSVGMELGRFARPKGIGVDREGRVHVVDAAFQNVQLFNAEGKLLMFYASPGAGKGQLYLPTDLFIDYDNVDYFQSFAAPDFKLEYIILISNQFGPNKINVYGFGKIIGEVQDGSAATQDKDFQQLR